MDAVDLLRSPSPTVESTDDMEAKLNDGATRNRKDKTANEIEADSADQLLFGN